MSSTRKIILGAALAALCAGAAPAQDDGAEMQRKTRELGLSVGNMHACLEGEEQESLRADWQLMFDLILKDVGSDLAFVFATSSGFGASLPREELDCAALRESWLRIREEFGLVRGDD